MDLILGVDGGGTKTTVQVADVNGNELSQTICSSTSYLSVGGEKAAGNLNEGVFAAVEKAGFREGEKDKVYFKSSCFGFAAYNIPEDLKIYQGIVFNPVLKKYINRRKCLIYNDTRIGLEAGSSRPDKIIIIAGTGSNCFGINEEGKQAGSNGWDYILADEGSGYRVSVEAMRAVMRAYDGRGRETLLTANILDELGLKNEKELNSWVYRGEFSKERIGSLAKVVCMTAGIGDDVSRDILKREAEEAVVSVAAVAEKLGFADREFDLVMVGGLFKCKEYFKDIFTMELAGRYRGINFRPLVTNPVAGAVKLAIENL